MPRPANIPADGIGSDSFLDIVANCVGILIILVMVVGVRAKHAPADLPTPADVAPDALLALENQAAALREQEESLRRQYAALEAESRRRGSQLASAESELTALRDAAAKRAAASLASQTDLERQRDELHRTQRQYDVLLREVRKLEQSQPRAKVIETYPTPVSKVVTGPEAHFQLRGGLVAYVPFDELADRLKNDARSKLAELRNSPELSAVVHSDKGFDLQYTLRRSGPFVEVVRITFLPKSNQLGEPLEAALQPDSLFRQAIAQFDPARTTVTLWTYPDSFEAYRKLKRELYLLGFSVAGRPLPLGQLITGSPHGSRSAAQ
jgi:multidrug efflux pump subunit AcrA (membrane-fusion protein)